MARSQETTVQNHHDPWEQAWSGRNTVPLLELRSWVQTEVEAYCQGHMEKSEDVNSPVPPSADNWLSTKIHKENFVLER